MTSESVGATVAPPFSATPALPTEVVKRDGTRAPFDLAKIASAIARAGEATGEFDASEATQLADAVGRVLAHRHTGGVPDIETIQDCVEHTLAAAGWFHTARAYIVYRDGHERLRAVRKTLVDGRRDIHQRLAYRAQAFVPVAVDDGFTSRRSLSNSEAEPNSKIV